MPAAAFEVVIQKLFEDTDRRVSPLPILPYTGDRHRGIIRPVEPKLTQRTISVLVELLQDPGRPRYGLDISKDAGLRATTVYDILIRLEEAAWVESEWEVVAPREVGRPRRRLYRLSGLGETSARTRIQGEIEKLQRTVAAPEPEPSRKRPKGGDLEPSPAGVNR